VKVAGHGITSLWRGLFIDERNFISLSRLQTGVWTVMVVSAFVTAGLVNLRVEESEPLDIALPGELWALIGISATSLVGTPLIHAGKERRKPNIDNFTATLENLGFNVKSDDVEFDTGDVQRERNLSVKLGSSARPMAPADDAPDAPLEPPPSSIGVMLRREKPDYSNWSDIFRGEDTGNGAHLDLGKVQMFYFTLAVVIAYTVALGNSFVEIGNSGITQFPELSSGIVALLGISHAAYLTNKAVDPTLGGALKSWPSKHTQPPRRLPHADMAAT
jgi:hypothetical protein